MQDDHRDAASHDFGALFRRVREVAQTLPGAQLAQRQLERVETRVLGELKHRLDHLDPDDACGAARAGATGRQPGLQERAARLLARAEEQTPEQATDALFHLLLDQLVADELLILKALAKEAAVPLLHVAIGPRLGPATQRLVSNVSGLGKLAGVRLLQQTPAYIARLRALGLVESAAEDDRLEIKYQMLEADGAVREAVEQAKPGALSTVHYQRRVLRLSNLGRAFWDACAPRD